MTPAQHWGRPYLQERFDALRTALTRPCVVMRETNFTLRNAGNGGQGATRGSMMARAETRKKHRELGAMFAASMRGALGASYASKPKPYDTSYAVVVLTRIAPRSLDGPNLDHAMKSVIDGIAEGLGVDDRSSLVRYVTSQETGKVARVRCELFIEPKP